MTKTELQVRIEMHENELKRLTGITVRCHSCVHFGARGFCAHWASQVPAEVQPVGCEEWRFDGVPF